MKILIGYNGTPSADAVLGDLDKAGLPSAAEVCLLMAIPPVNPTQVLASDPIGAAWLPMYAETGDEKKRVDAALESGARASQTLRARYPGWDIMVEARFETPAQSLLEFADAWKPDLIVVGSHGWSWLGRTFLGSSAEKVMAHAKSNVRLCHSRAGAAGASPRLLVAIDGSSDSGQAVEEIATRHWPVGTQVRLLAVRDYHPWTEALATADAMGMPIMPVELKEWTWMEKHLKETSLRLKARGLEVTAAIMEGDARQIILSDAESFRADCIFMGRRGLSGFQRYLLGSVSGSVASHAPCSVEIIRKPIVE